MLDMLSASFFIEIILVFMTCVETAKTTLFHLWFRFDVQAFSIF